MLYPQTEAEYTSDEQFLNSLDPKQHEKLVERFTRLFESAEAYKWRSSGEEHADWNTNIDYYNSHVRNRPKQLIRPNYIKPTLQLIASTVVGDRPRMNFSAQEDDDEAIGMITDGCVNVDWRNCGADDQMRLVSIGQLQTGSDFVKVYVVKKPYKSIGFCRVSSFAMFVTPDSDGTMQYAEAVFEVSRHPLSAIVKRYPKPFRGMTGLPDTAYLQNGGKKYRFGDKAPVVLLKVPGERAGIPRGGPDTEELDKRVDQNSVLVAEGLVREIGFSDLVFTDSQNRYIKDKWKRGSDSSVIVKFCCNRILEIHANPLNEDECPWKVSRNCLSTESFWGDDEIRPLIPMQDAIEMLISDAVMQVHHNADPPFVWDSLKGTKYPREISYKRRKVLVADGGADALKPLKTEDVAAGVRYAYGILQQAVKDVSGAFDPARGERTSGVIAAKAIDALKGSYYNRMSPRIGSFRSMMEQLGSLYANALLTVGDEEYIERRQGKFFASAWDYLKKTKSGRYDVDVEIGGAIDSDPANVVKFILEAGQAGAFSDDNRMSDDQRISLFKASRRAYPGSDMKIREIEKRKRAKVRDLTQANMQNEAAGAEPMPQPTGQPAPAAQPAYSAAA